MFDFSEVNLLIGTPAYNCWVHIDYNMTISTLHEYIKYSVMYVGNESLIPRGRNTIISHFYNNKIYTHLLFLDADIGLIHEGRFSPHGILKLIYEGKDVIGAPVPLKGTDSQGKLVYNVTPPIKNVKDNLFSVRHIGTAVFLLSRKAVDSLVDEAKSKNYVYSSNKHSRGSDGKVEVSDQYDVFRVGVVNETYLSEDYFACETLRNLGYDIYCDDSIHVIHNGNVRIGENIL